MFVLTTPTLMPETVEFKTAGQRCGPHPATTRNHLNRSELLQGFGSACAQTMAAHEAQQMGP